VRADRLRLPLRHLPKRLGGHGRERKKTAGTSILVDGPATILPGYRVFGFAIASLPPAQFYTFTARAKPWCTAIP
jgi:hypothetical protein